MEPEKKTRYRIIFYEKTPSGRYKRRFKKGIEGFTSMIQYYETLPIAAQLRAAKVVPFVDPNEESAMLIDISEDDYIMLRLMLGDDIKLREERAVPRATYSPFRRSHHYW